MFIGVCGFTSTGSSVVSDLLKEFDENCVIDSFEFVLPYFPDGLEDLRYHLCESPFKYLSSNAALYRFRQYISSQKRGSLNRALNGRLQELSDDFLDNIVQAKWKGYGAVDGVLNHSLWYRYVGSSLMAARIIPKLEKIKKANVYCYPVRDMEFSANPKDFDVYAKAFVKSIIDSFSPAQGQNIVMDQPFPGNNPQKCFRYFEDPYAIVVDRDPRDNYLFAKKFLFHKGRSIPSDKVKDYVAYYKGMRENMPYKNDCDRVLRINMESMIYEYDTTTKQVIDFLGLHEWNRPKSIFDPALSINNTQVFKRFPEYADDIKYIEDNLTDYLFDFNKYGEVNTSGQMFYGRSPLNKKQ